MPTEAEIAATALAATAKAEADALAAAALKEKPAHVDRAAYDSVTADMHRFKEEARKLKESIESAATGKLKEQSQFKELAERYEGENKTLKEENARIRTSIVEDKKFSTVRAAAQKLGIRAEAVSDLEGLDLTEVAVETTSTGKINILGADKFAERVKTLKPHWFTTGNTGNVNTQSTRVNDDGTAAVSTADLIAAEREGRKSGDMSKYHDLHKRYRLAGNKRG